MSAATAPYPVHPRDGETVNGSAAELEWASPGGGAQHHVQVSASDRFDSLLVDTYVGSSTSLTLMGLLPSDGRRLCWRVSSQRGQWSDAAWFLAGRGVRSSAVRPTAPTAASSAPVVRAAPLPDDAPAYLTGVTESRDLASSAFVLVLVLVLFLVAMAL